MIYPTENELKEKGFDNKHYAATLARAKCEEMKDTSESEIERVFNDCVLPLYVKRRFRELVNEGLIREE